MQSNLPQHSAGGRLPDFAIIGAMKSGTTSLYRWLESQPEVWLPGVKEPHFFSREAVWRRGISWYASLFADAPPGCLTGEASASYTSAAYAAIAARRLAEVLPDAKLVFLARHPIERLRSHYRHEVQRGRERQPFITAVRQPGNTYIGSSRYYACLAPYFEQFSRKQVCFVRFEELLDGVGWDAVLAHLGLPARPAPDAAYNISVEKRRYTPALRRLWEMGGLKWTARLPRSVRSLGKALFTRYDAGYARALEDSTRPLPDDIAGPIWEDAHRLELALGLRGPLWDSTETATEPDRHPLPA